MNCRAAHHLLSRARDESLTSGEQAELATHLSTCAECRAAESTLTKAVDTWRSTATQVATPDVEKAWLNIRREIRSQSSVGRSPSASPSWRLPVGSALAACALVLGAFMYQANDDEPIEMVQVIEPEVEYVEVPDDSAAMVYLDDESDWLVIWSDPIAMAD